MALFACKVGSTQNINKYYLFQSTNGGGESDWQYEFDISSVPDYQNLTAATNMKVYFSRYLQRGSDGTTTIITPVIDSYTASTGKVHVKATFSGGNIGGAGAKFFLVVCPSGEWEIN